MSSVSPDPLPPFQALLDEHGPVVLRVLITMVGRDEADDCWQDAFTAAFSAYPSLTSGRNLRAWLLTIARNTAIDALRARRRRALPIGEFSDHDELLGRLNPDHFESGYDPELWKRVDALPAKQRLAVIYRYVADLPYADIGVLIDCSTDAARRSAHEGVLRLRKESL